MCIKKRELYSAIGFLILLPVLLACSQQDVDKFEKVPEGMKVLNLSITAETTRNQDTRSVAVSGQYIPPATNENLNTSHGQASIDFNDVSWSNSNHPSILIVLRDNHFAVHQILNYDETMSGRNAFKIETSNGKIKIKLKSSIIVANNFNNNDAKVSIFLFDDSNSWNEQEKTLTFDYSMGAMSDLEASEKPKYPIIFGCYNEPLSRFTHAPQPSETPVELIPVGCMLLSYVENGTENETSVTKLEIAATSAYSLKGKLKLDGTANNLFYEMVIPMDEQNSHIDIPENNQMLPANGHSHIYGTLVMPVVDSTSDKAISVKAYKNTETIAEKVYKTTNLFHYLGKYTSLIATYKKSNTSSTLPPVREDEKMNDEDWFVFGWKDIRYNKRRPVDPFEFSALIPKGAQIQYKNQSGNWIPIPQESIEGEPDGTWKKFTIKYETLDIELNKKLNLDIRISHVHGWRADNQINEKYFENISTPKPTGTLPNNLSQIGQKSEIKDAVGMFANTENFTITATDLDKLVNIENAQGMFYKTKRIELNEQFLKEKMHPKQMDNMFSQSEIKQATLQNIINQIDTRNVSSMINIFGLIRTSLTLNLENWDVSNVTTFESFASNSSSLSITGMDKWNTSKCVNFSKMFQGTKLTDGDQFKNWDVSKAEDMSAMFSSSTDINLRLSLGNWNVSKVKTFSEMFSRIYSVPTGLRYWDVSSAETLSSMFSNIKNGHFEPLEWGEKTRKVKTIGRMFAEIEVNDLSNIIESIKKWDLSSLIDNERPAIEDAFNKWSFTNLKGIIESLKSNTTLPERKIHFYQDNIQNLNTGDNEMRENLKWLHDNKNWDCKINGSSYNN